MKKLYEEQKHTLYELQNKLDLDKMRLYRYASGQIKIEKMPVDLILEIAIYEGIEPHELYKKMKKYQERNK